MIQSATSNYMVPASGGTHAVAYQDNLTASPTAYDFRQFQLDNFPFTPQGAYIDNTNGTAAAVLTFAPMGFKVSVPAGAFAAVNFPAPKGMQVAAVGAGVVPIVWVDYPVLPQLFFKDGSSQSVSIPAAPSGAPGYSSVLVPGPVFDAQQGAIASGATSATLTPAAQNENLRKLEFSISGDATLGAAGEIGITIQANAKTIYSTTVAVGTVAGVGALFSKVLDFDSIAPAMGAGNVTVTLSGALTTGKVSVNAYFG